MAEPRGDWGWPEDGRVWFSSWVVGWFRPGMVRLVWRLKDEVDRRVAIRSRGMIIFKSKGSLDSRSRYNRH